MATGPAADDTTAGDPGTERTSVGDTQSLRDTIGNRARWVVGGLVVFGALVALVWIYLICKFGQCGKLGLWTSFSGSADVFDSLRESPGTNFSIGEARFDIVAIASVLAGFVLVCALGFLRFWKYAWRSGWAVTSSSQGLWRLLCRSALGLIVVTTISSLALLKDTPDGVTLRGGDFWPIVVRTLTWLTTLVTAGVAIMGLSLLVALWENRNLPVESGDAQEPSTPPAVDQPSASSDEQPPLGVCLSGGGIRSAAFSLGAMAALEGHPRRLLARANYLSTVSGGGYVGVSWRVARQNSLNPADIVIGNPHDAEQLVADRPFDDNSALDTTTNFFDYVRLRRQFLTTGRGGTPMFALLMIAAMAIQLAMIAGAMWLIAWPLGHLASSWLILGDTSDIAVVCGTFAQPGCEPMTVQEVLLEEGRIFNIDRRSWLPSALLVAAAAVAVVVRILMWNTKLRRGVDAVISTLLGAAAAAFVILVGLPWILDVAAPWLNRLQWGSIVGFLTAGSVVGFAQLAAKSLGPKLARVGGVLVAIFAAVIVVQSMSQAAQNELFFGIDSPGSWQLMWAIAIVLSAAIFLSIDPTRWSLHRLYRFRLRAAFVATAIRNQVPTRLRPDDPESKSLRPMIANFEDTLDRYARSDAGPVPLVCCAAATSHEIDTGLSAVSMVFSPEGVTVYGRDLRELNDNEGGRQVPTTASSWAASDYVHALTTTRHGGLLRVVHEQLREQKSKHPGAGASTPIENDPGLVRRSRASLHRNTASGGAPLTRLSGLAAVSGAAAAPALGRADLGSTNSAIAALNIRLGVWMPNPAHDPPSSDAITKWKSPRLNYLFKEVFGQYDHRDAFLYVTDGGHWENLGLVELLRRRCKLIICSDASDDKKGHLNALEVARNLASIELYDDALDETVRVTFDPETQWDQLIAPEYGMAPRGWMRGDIVYPDGSTGQLVFVKSMVNSQMSHEVKTYAAIDEQFPNYSTLDQWQADPEFMNLAKLGYDNMYEALADPIVNREIAKTVRPRIVVLTGNSPSAGLQTLASRIRDIQTMDDASRIEAETAISGVDWRFAASVDDAYLQCGDGAEVLADASLRDALVDRAAGDAWRGLNIGILSEPASRDDVVTLETIYAEPVPDVVAGAPPAPLDLDSAAAVDNSLLTIAGNLGLYATPVSRSTRTGPPIATLETADAES